MKTTLTTAPLFAFALLLVACGGGDSAITDDDTNTDPEKSDVMVLDETIKPLLSSDGAEAGLKGCLNRGLFVNGPHTVSTNEVIARILSNGITTSDQKTYIDRYEVLKVSDTGVSEVDVTTTFTSTEGTATGTFAAPYELEGYQLRVVGPSRDMPDPNALIQYFDLEEGASVPQTVSSGATYVDTYVGREEINIAGSVMTACRVDTIITQEIDQPEFRLVGTVSKWYGLGTGLKLLEQSVSFPDSELDRSTEDRYLTGAEINGVKIF